MSKTWFPGGWSLLPPFNEVVFIKAHERADGEHLDREQIQINIPWVYLRSLVDFLHKEGFIRPEITTEGRSEDLKIIHRLLDVVERRR